MHSAKAKISAAAAVDRRAASARREADQDLQSQVTALRTWQAVLELTPDGRVLDANQRMLELMGYGLEEIIGKHHDTLVARATGAADTAWARLAAGEARMGEVEFAAKGGRPVWMLATYTPVRHSDGTLSKVIAYATDITDRKLLEQENTSRAASLEGLRAKVMIADRDFNIRYVNAAAMALMQDAEAELRKELPRFSVATLIGSNIDIFHKNPAHQRRMLADLVRPHAATIRVGQRSFDLMVVPLTQDGQRSGYSVEWSDADERLKVIDYEAYNAAIGRAQAVIEFGVDGRVLTANENFLNAMGYGLEEIRGQHHSMFVDPLYRQSVEYRMFWDKLGRGDLDAGQYKRIAKGGREVWLQASYNPVKDLDGKPYKVVKFATDITMQKVQAADFEGQLAAIGKAQAVIEFSLDGRILNANQNFLTAVGYALEEIRGQHHGMFVDASYRQSAEYRMFWDKLGRGEHESGQYKRVAKGGREIWLQASYNPILDMNGKPFKVMKYASDVTAQVAAAEDLRLAVKQIQAAVTAVQASDLTERVPLEGKQGDIHALCAGVNGVIDTMANVVSGILEASGTIAAAAREISMGNTDLSQRTEEQAASLEQTAASLEELTGTVRQNADNAQEANKLASSASEVAMKGGQVVTDVVRTMEGISDASRKIADIIGVIDEIAFQTNILALNAAVEAARAGEQGRGFAVVAAEVRNLAQRSANAAKEIKSLISESVAKVESGSRLVTTAGATMEEIVQSVKRVTNIMAEISAASKEQSSGIEEVNTAVTQMDKITQQNAALVEEAAAAAKSMEDQTDGLAGMVAAFRIDGLAPVAVSVAPRKPAAPAVRHAPPPPTRKAAPPPRPPSRHNGHDDWKEF
jgi:methyl-accepting chemotaxis protein